MKTIKNILAVIGLVSILLGAAVAIAVASTLSEFDPKAPATYAAFFKRLLDSKNPGIALDYAVPVKDGITYEDLKQSLQSLAKQNNVVYVGEHPFYKRLQARSGKPHRIISFLGFCHPKSGEIISNHNDAYTAYMPSRIAIVQDKNGKFWLHTMRIDLMIYGGKTLPPEVKQEAMEVWEATRNMMLAAANGDF